MQAIAKNEQHTSQVSPLEIVGLIVHHVRPVLGWRTGLFLAKWIVRLPHYRKRFVRPDDDGDLVEIKRSLFPLAALHHELARELGEEARALVLSHALALDVAVRLQRRWYLTSPKERGWDAFHREHEREMRSGILRRNEHTLPVVTPDRVEFRVTRCRLYEAMCAMAIGPLTQAFCESDEIVFNECVPAMRFHRDDAEANTIARGARDCAFVFERAQQMSPPSSVPLARASDHATSIRARFAGKDGA